MGHHGRMDSQLRTGSATSPTLPEADVPGSRYPRITSFRSRRSTISAAQQRAWEEFWPELGISAAPGGNQPLDTRAWFGRDAPTVLEIGCGTGTSTLEMAKREPDVDVIAVDVYRRGLAQLLCAMQRERVGNIRLIRGDAVQVLEDLISPGTLTGVRVFFPDPWPKARHHKRRLLQPRVVCLIAEALRPGGVLHTATDHPGYAAQIGEAGDAEPRLCRLGAGSAGLTISVVRPASKYETKARQAGSAVIESLWERR